MDISKNQKEINSIINEKTYSKKLHYYIVISLVFIFISLLLFFWIFLLLNSEDGNVNSALKAMSIKLGNEKEAEIIQDKNLVPRAVDGVLVSEGEENLFPLAIVIDNHTDARPPESLAKAQLVFESEAEGGITRYLAIFSSGEKFEKIGPIRSARPYFIDWAREFSSLFIHVGGSPEALVKLKKENLPSINEFYYENYFWRDNQRLAPHNVFTSTQLLRDYLKTENLTQGNFFSWQYKDDKIQTSLNNNFTIKINYNLPGYVVEWKYDSQSNDFIRYLDSLPHKTSSGDTIRAKNIIIQYVNSEVVDDKLRLKVENVGTGEAVVCLDGECFLAIWEKKNPYARTRFYERGNEEIENPGAELKFNRGTTWVEAINPEITVDY